MKNDGEQINELNDEDILIGKDLGNDSGGFLKIFPYFDFAQIVTTP